MIESGDDCTCDYVELRARLSMRVYDGTCPEHNQDSPDDYEKHPFDDQLTLAEWTSIST